MNFIIWGASKAGEAAYLLYEKKINIIAFTDSNSDKWNKTFCNSVVLNPENAMKIAKEDTSIRILIASMYVEEIYGCLHEHDVPDGQIIIFSSRLERAPLLKRNTSKSSSIYINKYGVKANYQIMKGSYFPNGNIELIPINQLKLGFDWLNNQHTLLGTNINNSPHFLLMECISQKNELRECSYMKRKEKGTLDFRCAKRVDQSFIDQTINYFNTRNEEILSNTYQPIKIARFGGNIYILDGKHRAALACLLDKELIRAIDITYTLNDSFYHWIFELIQYKKEFSINVEKYKDYLFQFNEIKLNQITKGCNY